MNTTDIIKKNYPLYLFDEIFSIKRSHFNVGGKIYIMSEIKKLDDNEIEVTYVNLASVIEQGIPTIEYFKLPSIRDLEK